MKYSFNFIILIALLLSSCNFPETNAGINVYDKEHTNKNETIDLADEERPSTNWTSPPLGVKWQWQLSNYPIDMDYDVLVYDVDYEETSKGDVARLKSEGHYVICYISMGSWEEWREDADDFPESVLGRDYEGWPGERWLDIRQIEELAPILEARMDICKNKGFDGIEPDNMDGYTNTTGFPLSYEDQLMFNLWLGEEAHQRGLSIGMKNNEEQTADLVDIYDWAMTEDCFVDDWCEELSPFIQAGKPVFAAEYTDTEIDFEDFCQHAYKLGLSPILKDRDLTSWVQYCP